MDRREPLKPGKICRIVMAIAETLPGNICCKRSLALIEKKGNPG